MEERKPPYRDVMNRYRTQSLFWEWSQNKKDFKPLWTLNDLDHHSGEYPSLKRLFIEAADPTEYSFAMKYLGSFEHWQVLCSRNWFKPTIEGWRAELALKIKSEALVVIKKVAKDEDDSRSLQAARYLADKGWLDKAEKGRPTKESIVGETKRLANKASELDEDAIRAGIDIGPKH